MNEIQKYEPMMQVTCKDGRILLFPKSKYPAYLEAEKNLLFIPIEGVRVNKYEIKYVEDLPDDYDVLIGQPENVRSELLAELRNYEATLGHKAPREVAVKKLERILDKNARKKWNQPNVDLI